MPIPAVIKWYPSDIHTLRENWTEEQCIAFLEDISKTLVDRSVELGWEVIETLLPPEEDK